MNLGKTSASRIGGGADTSSRTSRLSSQNGRQRMLTGLMMGPTIGQRTHLTRLTDKLGLSVHVTTRYEPEYKD